MGGALARKTSTLEKRVAERTEKLRICSCRFRTRFHGADCLDAIMKGICRVCPRHGFRNLGYFLYTPKWYPLFSTPRHYPLSSEVDQLCPCPPHPWRSSVPNGPHSREDSTRAWEAWQNLPPTDGTDLEEENRRINLIFTAYVESYLQWVEKKKQQLPEPS
jgi:hypothetical protein